MTKYLAVEGERSRLSSACVLGCVSSVYNLYRDLSYQYSRGIYRKSPGGRSAVNLLLACSLHAVGLCSLEKGFFSRHIYSRGMGRNVGKSTIVRDTFLPTFLVSIIRKNLGNLHKASPKLISPNLPRLLESKSLLLREVDEMAIW
jgi:hypothetical protein